MEKSFTGCDGWLTGIETLDAQHVELAACISRVANACCCSENTQSGGSVSWKQNLSELVGNLYQAVKKHFEYEEAFMLEAEYPDYAAHRREHIMLLAELKLAINVERESGDIKLGSEMARGLKIWFMAHIKHSDCRFSAYISSRRMVAE
ncbi:MAG: hypothetical protein BMS9Abin36_1780 [Gammaproteobacteria bacterium]|nr:MAG: hypothetical protein BMS9Abin36_1780 [Gammaproteobacteria bacterium]